MVIKICQTGELCLRDVCEEHRKSQYVRSVLEQLPASQFHPPATLGSDAMTHTHGVRL